MRRILLGITLLCLLLTGCGFHLRGSMPLSPPLHNLYLKTKDPYGPLARNLRDYFKYSHVPLASSPETASAVLDILNVTESQELLNVSGTQLTRQYNLV